MWMKRIEAERYGALEAVSLGDLGPGLTVVLGPNEAGKSSLTSLVRHVLYGFPHRRSKERGYHVEGSARHGRLVFADNEGEWAVERMEGAGGGGVVVRTFSGTDRPALHTELIRGVSADAYRVVFGFGLAEMAEVVGSSDDIVSRLYAAGAGIAVSPQDVRNALNAKAEGLFKPSGRNPAINAIASEAADLKKHIRELRHGAEALAEKRERLAELLAEASRAGADAAAVESRRDRLEAAVREIERIEERLHTVREELVERRTALLHARTQADESVADQRVLDSASLIEGLETGLAVERERADRITTQRSCIATLERSIAECFSVGGLEESAAASVTVDAETRAGLESWRDRLVRLELRAEAASSAAGDAANAAQADRETGSAAAATSPAPPATAYAGWAIVVLGAAAAVAGAVSATWLLLGFGVLTALVGGWIALVGRSAGGGGRETERHARASEVRRLAAEETRTAANARSAREDLEQARHEWDSWRAERGLLMAATPTAATDVLATVSEARRLGLEHAAATGSVVADLERSQAFLERVRDLAVALGIDSSGIGPTTVPVVMSRARAMLDEATELVAKAVRAAEQADALAPRIAALEAKEGEEESRARAILEEHEFEAGLSQAAELSAAATREAASARARFDELDRERAMLAGEVSVMETESESSKLALDLAGARERIAALAEQYVVARVAAMLLDRAQQVYERERQPAVMQDAGRVLSTMTGGRYQTVTIPLGSSAVHVLDASARARGTGVLSTGTAEQLYLSLRIALLASLGEIGAGLPVLMDDVFANFDPERKAGAAAAVAELARIRQVVVFTCHPQTAAALSAAEPGLVTLTLDRC